MREKTPFQIKCSSILLNKVGDLGVSFDLWDFVDGNEESYFYGALANIKVWIYEDGACIKKDKKTYLYEDLDFKNEDELIQNFIDQFLKLFNS